MRRGYLFLTLLALLLLGGAPASTAFSPLDSAAIQVWDALFGTEHLANYHGFSQLAQNTFDPRHAGPTSSDIAQGTLETEAGIATFGVYNLVKGGIQARQTGDWNGLQDTFAAYALGGALIKAAPVAARMSGAANKAAIFSRVETPAAAAAETGNTSVALNDTELGAGQGLRCAGPACFVAGTLVATACGLQAIETIRTNDLVWSCDVATGRTNLNPVLRTFIKHAGATLDLQIGGTVITATLDHPFWMVHHGWTLAGKLHPGDWVQTLAGTNAPIARVQPHPGAVTVYNFEVAHAHSYFVGPTRVLVHNAPCPPEGVGGGPVAAEGGMSTALIKRPVEIRFPAQGLSAAEREMFSFHLAEQEMALNKLSLTAPEDLELNLLNYKNLKPQVNAARKLAREYLPGSGDGLHAAHRLDAVAGGYINDFVGFRPPVQSYIGSLWRTRASLIQPGMEHRLIPEFGD